MVDDRRDELHRDRGLDGDAGSGGRPDHGRFQFGRRHGGNRHGRVAERGAESMELQWPVVEVGSKRGDDTQAAVARRDGVHQAVEECALFVVGREREELLELVDHEEELAARPGTSRRNTRSIAGFVGLERVGEHARVVFVGDSDPTEALRRTP